MFTVKFIFFPKLEGTRSGVATCGALGRVPPWVLEILGILQLLPA